MRPRWLAVAVALVALAAVWGFVIGQRYAIGHVEEDGRHLFVTQGIGTSIIPVRFGVPPEISLLTLAHAAAAR